MTKRTGRMEGRPPAQTARTKKLQELWLRAASEPVEIDCKTKSAAVNARFQLYNAVRAVRGNPELSPELAEAVGAVQVSLIGDEMQIVRLARSATVEALDSAFAALGITGEAVKVKTEEDLEIEASMARLREKMAQQETEPVIRPTNPYYTR